MSVIDGLGHEIKKGDWVVHAKSSGNRIYFQMRQVGELFPDEERPYLGELHFADGQKCSVRGYNCVSLGAITR